MVNSVRPARLLARGAPSDNATERQQAEAGVAQCQRVRAACHNMSCVASPKLCSLSAGLEQNSSR